MAWSQEELIGLGILLIVTVGLALVGKLTPETVDALKYIGGAFFASKGMQGLLPGKK